MRQKQKAKIKIPGCFNGFDRKSTKSKIFSWQIFNKVLIVLIIISSIYFIVSVNDLSIKGFMLQELKLKIAELDNKNADLELKIMELESYENISERAQGMKMVKVDKIDYITIIEEVVAVK
jgi:cell division protein FtsL